MSGPSYGSQESQAAYTDSLPPPYDSRENELISVIENERLRRKIKRKIDDIGATIVNIAQTRVWDGPAETDYPTHAQFYLKKAQAYRGAAQLLTEIANVLQSRKTEQTELYTAMARLTDKELDRTVLL
ncbi:hypothetical protein N7493_002309 [Penicillium malachiteum]|uniref:Uncharacterized protein n=1 Tax=Penicillium malachiteum TaxID=1324776 RepID=A0AAD6HRL9_9EURO|nr:hypothetical protein N7493_002309 [Penicillium malachiteum]